MPLIYYNYWTNDNYQKFIKELSKLQEKEYLDFNKRLIFTKYKMIGIRIPELRKITKEISKTNFRSFLDCKTEGIFEEIFIKGVLLSYIKDYNEFVSRLNDFLNLVDNWAICDMCISSYKIINKHKDKFLNNIKEYLVSLEEFKIRIGIIFLLDYYLTEEYIDEVFNLLENINYHSYYIDMAIAWVISIAFIKYQEKTLDYLEKTKLDKEILRKIVQKIRDSKRVSKEVKDYVLKYKK